MSLLRLNLSHTRIDELPRTLEYVQSRTELPLCLDTEGAQIRTSPAWNQTLDENRSDFASSANRSPTATLSPRVVGQPAGGHRQDRRRRLGT